MDIGVISDIHGDSAALEIALNRLEQVHGVACSVCAGDLVGRGPQPDRVVDLMRARSIPTVRGNHDEWNYVLEVDNKTYLKELPLEWRGALGGRQVYMCHGKPGNNLWGLYRDHVSNTLLNMMLTSLNADVLISGHTHVPLYVRVERGVVLNPGSVYTFSNARATSHTYGVLHLDDLSFDLYDVTIPAGEQVALIG
ncbi:MAG TPA: metallophosphoesterase family protein [Candidatus Limnocylindrales bacterium]|nr:metallophosphoesterase family protein [Candidatus Limnocylindrales bacterium]